MDKIAVMQPYLFPYLGYFQLMQAVDKFIFYDDVHFINRGWINRNRILVNREPMRFTVPLQSASQNKLIREVQLANPEQWKKKFLKTLEHAYKHAPYYSRTVQIVHCVLDSTAESILQWILSSIELLCREFSITCERSLSSSYKNQELSGAARLIDLVKLESGDHYINASGGAALYSKEEFRLAGIELSFLEPELNEYDQQIGSFIPGLSILDVLMFNSTTEIKSELKKYRLN